MPWADVIAGAVILFLLLLTASCGVALRDRPRSPWDRLFDHAPDRPRAKDWPEMWGYSHDTGGPLPRRTARRPSRRSPGRGRTNG